MSRHYANRLIKAGKIRAEMVPIVTKMGLPEPRNEAQLRELSRLSDTQSRVEAYREAYEENEAGPGTVTAKKLAEVVAERRGATVSQKPKFPTPAQRLAEARSTLEDLEKALESGKEIGRFLQRLRDLLGKQS